MVKIDLAEIRDIYPFKSNYHIVKGYKYHYIDEGKGKPMVMIHGNPTWSFFYRRLIEEFSKTNRVIVPDHLGCGLSDKPQEFEYRLETHIENLESLIVWIEAKNGVFTLDEEYYRCSGGMLEEPLYYSKLAEQGFICD